MSNTQRYFGLVLQVRAVTAERLGTVLQASRQSLRAFCMDALREYAAARGVRLPDAVGAQRFRVCALRPIRQRKGRTDPGWYGREIELPREWYSLIEFLAFRQQIERRLMLRAAVLAHLQRCEREPL